MKRIEDIMLKYLLPLLALLLGACDAGNSKLSGEGSAVVASRDASAPSANENPSEPTENAPSSLASAPVSIGGGFLTCSFAKDSAVELQCLSANDAGEPIDFQASGAYIISGSPEKWTSTLFRRNPAGTGRWIISVPKDVSGSFGVALSDDNNVVLVDWLQSEESPAANLVKDGGFEDIVMDPNGIFFQYIKPADQKSWKARSTAGCAEPIFELENEKPDDGVSIAPYEGKQFTELDSGCPFDNTTKGNVAIHQDMKLQAGHLYQISFAYRNRNKNNNIGKFKVSFNGSILMQRETTDSEWQLVKFNRLVSSAKNSRIEFEELGVLDNFGTLIDDVRVTDLGVGPEANP